MPPLLDEYVSAESPCRVIDAFVDGLNMAELGFTHTQRQYTGCPSYDPKDLLKLYIYGYLNRVRSSRRLENETYRNVEVMWLLRNLKPDDKTICNFRSENGKALKNAYKEFNQLCLKWELFGLELESFDGSKFRANNSRSNHYTKEKVEKMLAKLSKRAEKYLQELAENDATLASEAKADPEKIKQALETLMERKSELEEIAKRIEENGGKAVCATDPDAALMKQSGGKGFAVSYNMQTAVDGKNGLIAGFDVNDHVSDVNELSGMVTEVKEDFGVEGFNATADTGYSNGKEIEACERMGVSCHIPAPEPSHQPENRRYHRNNFVYDPERNVYTCPEGNEMPQVRVRERDGYKVYSNREACMNCPNKDKCTKSKTLREIERNPKQEFVDRAAANARENKEVYRRRKELSEHPFGVIKYVWGFAGFLLRGIGKVTGEASLMCTAFNFRRSLTILGAKRMLELLG
jgi:transposase